MRGQETRRGRQTAGVRGQERTDRGGHLTDLKRAVAGEEAAEAERGSEVMARVAWSTRTDKRDEMRR